MPSIRERIKRRELKIKTNLEPGQYAGKEIARAFVFLFEDEIRKRVLKHHEEQNNEIPDRTD